MSRTELEPRLSEKDKLWGVAIVLKPAGPKTVESLQNGRNGAGSKHRLGQDGRRKRRAIRDRIEGLIGSVVGLLLMQQTLSSRCSRCSRPIEIPVSSFLRDEVYLAKEDWLWACERCWDESQGNFHFHSQDFG